MPLVGRSKQTAPSHHSSHSHGTNTAMRERPTSSPRRIMLIEPHAATRRALLGVLQREAELRAFAPARSELARSVDPPADVAIVGAGNEITSALETCRVLNRRWPGLPIVLWTLSDSQRGAADAAAAGAWVVVPKMAGTGVLIEALQKLARPND